MMPECREAFGWIAPLRGLSASVHPRLRGLAKAGAAFAAKGRTPSGVG